MKKLLFVLAICLWITTTSFAQTAKTYTGSELLAQLKKLNVLGSVLYIAAHPDDENTRLLAYLANEKKFRTGYLSLTRGDGGQNLIGDEQGIDLGLIRTQELLAARRVDGAEQFFSSAYDFGFSKNPEEALRIWDHNKILGDVVYIIRAFKPDVIICRFPTTGEGGHGHHTASAILAEEAFDAAADSTKFPEQLTQGVSIWQSKRLLWNTFNFGSTNTQKEDQFKIDVGMYNPLLGKSYGEIAAESRSQHKSQGFGVPAQRGSSLEYFKTIKGTAPVTDLFDGVNTTWARFTNQEFYSLKNFKDGDTKDTSSCFDAMGLQHQINSMIQHFDVAHPENSVNALTQLEGSLWHKYDDFGKHFDYWINKKLAELKSLIERCSGLYMETTAAQANIIAADSAILNHNFVNRMGIAVSKAKVYSIGRDFQIDGQLNNQSITHKDSCWVKNSTAITQPYWLQNPMNSGSYQLSSNFDLINPSSNYLKSTFNVHLNGDPYFFEKQIMYKFTDPIKGEIYQPAPVLPALYIEPEKSLIIHTKKDKAASNIILIANKDITIQNIYANEQALPIPMPITLKKNERKVIPVVLNDGNTRFTAIDGKTTFDSYAKEIKYDHIPNIIYHKPSEVNCKYVDVKIGAKKIGYIEGAGDKVIPAMQQMGYEVSVLKRGDITLEKLKSFDAIVTGVRAYNTNEWLNEVYNTLMEYVKNGGLMLVQYNTSNQLGPVKAKIAPYPFNITRNRITDENATVEILNPELSIFNYPNKITAADFEGWIQERSIYHVADADSNYIAPIRMKDPGEKDNTGSLLITNYGKGRFVYTGLALFRQLPAGVTGAYRLFANLLANKK